MDGDPSAPVAVFRSRFGRRTREHALVLHSVGIPCIELQEHGEHVLAVQALMAERAARELALYERENRGWRRPEELPLALTQGWGAVTAWCACLVIVFWLERTSAFTLDWHASGRNDGELVRSGEAWRVATALTLHADAVHLLSNLFFGALFVALACELLGNGLALLSITVAGALGNYANDWLRGGPFASIGASTAVFAALGLVGAHRWQRRKQVRARGAASWVPLVASAFLLAYLGSGGERSQASIDVVGHVCGFASGAVLGTLLGRFAGARPTSRALQTALGLCALAVVALSWLAAFRR